MDAVATQVDAPIDIPYLEGTHYTGSGVQTAGVAASNPSYTGGYSGNPTPKSSGGGGGGKSSSPKNSTPKDNKPKDKDITQEQIVIEDLEEENVNVIEQINNIEILGEKTNTEEQENDEQKMASEMKDSQMSSNINQSNE